VIMIVNTLVMYGLKIYHDGTSSVVVDLAGGGLYLSGSSSVNY
jgi:hypothetical protein